MITQLPDEPNLSNIRASYGPGTTTDRIVAAVLLADIVKALARYKWGFSSGTKFTDERDGRIGRQMLSRAAVRLWNEAYAQTINNASGTLELANEIAANQKVLTSEITSFTRFFCEKWLVELQEHFRRSPNEPSQYPIAQEGPEIHLTTVPLVQWRLECIKWFRDRKLAEYEEKISYGDKRWRGISEDQIQQLATWRSVVKQLEIDQAKDSETLSKIESDRARLRDAEIRAAEKTRVLELKYKTDLDRDYVKTATVPEYSGEGVTLDAAARHTIEEDFVRTWLGNSANVTLKNPPTTEQIRVISRITDRLLVRARAGSGKTTTIVARVVFLIRHCGMAPETILLFAFNKKAALKLEQDLVLALGIENLHPDQAAQRLPVVQTFDGFAGSVSGVAPLSRPELNGLFQDAIEDLLMRDEESVKSAMLHFFRAEWAHVKSGVLPGREAVLEERRSESALYTLAGEQVKSRGEHRIANWLFEHDIPYTYEKPVRQIEGRWTPDFTLLPDSAMPILVEYLGLQGDPDYDRKTEWKKQRLADMPEDKRPTAVWLEPSSTESQQSAPPNFIVLLTAVLEQHHRTLKKLTDDEIWQKIRHSAMPQFRTLTIDVVGRAKQLRWNVQKLAAAAQSTPVPQLLTLCAEVMRFVDSHNKTDKHSYAEICWVAGDKLQENEVKSKDLRSQGGQYRPIDIGNFQEVIVDEFQDYAQRFKAIVDGVLAAAPTARLFVVGDDWQAINRYAGSEPRFITKWGDTELTLTTNHRSLPEIVELGNSVMPNRGPAARAPQSKSRATVLRMKLGDLRSDAIELSAVRAFTSIQPQVVAAICRLALPHLRAQQSVAVLAHTNYELDVVKNVNVRTESPLKGLLLKLADLKSGHIDVDTVHGVKGQEADVVVLLADGFPLLHPHRVIFEVFGDTEPELLEDERRLLYVGITRAKHTLYVLTGVKERKIQWANDLAVSEGSWEQFPPVGLHVEQSDRLAVVLSGTATKELKDQIKAAGFKGMGPPSWAWERLVVDNSQPTPEAILAKLRMEPWFPSGDMDGILTIEVVNGQREVLGREAFYPEPSAPRPKSSAADDLPF
jgi:DNA helicase-4